MKTKNIKEVFVKRIHVEGLHFCKPGFDEIVVPNRHLSKVFIAYEDEEELVEVFSFEGDDVEEMILAGVKFVKENDLEKYPVIYEL